MNYDSDDYEEVGSYTFNVNISLPKYSTFYVKSMKLKPSFIGVGVDSFFKSTQKGNVSIKQCISSNR